jgi:hypothetical protein
MGEKEDERNEIESEDNEEETRRSIYTKKERDFVLYNKGSGRPGLVRRNTGRRGTSSCT